MPIKIILKPLRAYMEYTIQFGAQFDYIYYDDTYAAHIASFSS